MTVIEAASGRGKLAQAIDGAIIFTIAGSVWAIYGSLTLQNYGRMWLITGLILAALGLLSAVFFLRAKVKLLPAGVSGPEWQKRDARNGRIFMIVNAVQGAAMFVAANICINFLSSEYVAPSIALIVGLHFLVLAFLLHIQTHWISGGLISLLAVVTVLAVPMYAAGKSTAEDSVFLWGVTIGLGNALILWSMAINRLLIVRKGLPAMKNKSL